MIFGAIFWWIFPSGQEMVEKWSENGPRETAYITQWSKNGRKIVPGRPQTILGVLFDHFLTIFLQIEGAAFGRPPKGAGGLRPPAPLGSLFRLKYSKNSLKILRGLFLEYFSTSWHGMGSPWEYFSTIFGVFLGEPPEYSKIVLFDYFP